jgi:hypothetical protein
MDAEIYHANLELEQLKVDIASAMRQRGSLEKTLGNKVLVFALFLNCSWRNPAIPAATICTLFNVF